MTWRKIEDGNSDFIRVYEVNTRMHMTASFFPVNELPPHATHTDITDKPSSDHIWDDAGDQWVEDLVNIKLNKKAALESQAREDVFNNSPQKTAMDTAHGNVDSANSKAAIDAITL